MICQLHPSNGEVEACPSCEAGSPPDIGIEVNDEIDSDDKLNPPPTKEELELMLSKLNPKDIRAIAIKRLLDENFKD